MDHRTLNDLADELRAALLDAGIDAVVEPLRTVGDRYGLVRLDADGRSTDLLVAGRSDLRPVHAAELITAAGDDDPQPVVPGVVVADRVAERSRQTLRDNGWGWLDRRRGHLRVWVPGLRLDTAVTPTAAPAATAGSKPTNPFTPAGRNLALWLLTHPDDHASPRALHRELDISAGQVSNLLHALEAESLLRRDRRPLVPELFWALAEHWQPRRHALAAMPTPAELAAAPELRAERWVLTDTAAALAHGAPVVAHPDSPVDLYLPDERALSWLLARSVLAAEWSQRLATVAVAPSPLACDPRLRTLATPWPLAHPVVVALDLAADRGRGRQIVDEWAPPPESGIIRVW